MDAKETVERYLDTFFAERFDLAAVRDLLHDDFEYEGPLMKASGADDFIAQLQTFGGGTPQAMRAKNRRLLVEGDTVAALYDFFIGTDKTMTFSEWYWVRGDKLERIKLVYDPRPLLASDADSDPS